ncbi:MAG: hypothetical protein B7Y73_02490 [Acidocella sp. 35-58-6]|nr:MAG: hypothetical protein B7Y73_02490 [Acidocella sp. 35-58-6]
MHLHALRLLGDHYVGEFFGHIAVKLIAFHINPVGCRSHGGQHGTISGRAIFQKHHLIAGYKWRMSQCHAAGLHHRQRLGFGVGWDRAGQVRVELRQLDTPSATQGYQHT